MEKLSKAIVVVSVAFLIGAFLMQYPKKTACEDKCEQMCLNESLREAAGALMWAEFNKAEIEAYYGNFSNGSKTMGGKG